MQTIGKWIGRALLLLILAGGGLWLLGPREPAPLRDWQMPTIAAKDADGFFAAQEARFDDIRPGTEKRIVWADTPGTQTRFSVLYLHGFSATSEEIRPLPDLIAAELGANLVFARLAGHGRGPDAMGTATVAAWMQDTADALGVARAIGEQVVVLSTSTGGTLAAAAALQPELAERVAAMIFVAPNFGVNTALEPLLTAPAARYWLPALAGRRRSFEPRNPLQEKYWTMQYPSVAVLPMAALVEKVRNLDFSAALVPALFWFSGDDKVVQPGRTHRVAKAWGGASQVALRSMGPDDDPYSHVIAGDILSPGQTQAAATQMRKWLASHGVD